MKFINAIRRLYLSFFGTQSQKDLIIARQRIKKGWIKGDLAEDAQGHGVSEISERAVSFCMVGVMKNVAYTVEPPYGKGHSRYADMRDRVLDNLPRTDEQYFSTIPGFNDADDTKLEDVLAVFDKAIFYKAKDADSDGEY